MGISAVVFKSLAADFTSIPPPSAGKGAEIVMLAGRGFYRNRSSLKCLRHKITRGVGATGYYTALNLLQSLTIELTSLSPD